MNEHPRIPRPWLPLLTGLWIGLAYGLFEALEVMGLSLVPGALSWRNANTADVLWFAPVFYGVLFGFVGLLAAGLQRVLRNVRWDVPVVFGGIATAIFLAGSVHPRLLSHLAAAILGIGIAMEATRQYVRRREQAVGLMSKTLPLLAIVVLAGGILIRGGASIREHAALADLPSPPTDVPNVLLLIIDTQRADHLGSYGYGRNTTPNIDRLAGEGALYERAYAPSSWTLPSHASMFVGRPLHEHRAGLMRRPYLDDRYPTIAEAFREFGYGTGGFVANTYWTGRQTGLDRGFIRYEDMYGSLGDAFLRTTLGRLLAYEVLPSFGLRDIPGRKWAGDLHKRLLHWIDGQDGRPFFAFVNYFDVHGPYLPPRPFLGSISPLPGEQEGSGKIEIGALTGDIVVPPDSILQRMIDRYDESIMYLDHEVGRLMDALRERGILDNTVVIISSDHGESWGEHNLMYHGHSLYYNQIHIPLIVRYPEAIPEGVRETRPVSLTDLPVTLATLIPLSQRFPGSSFLPRDLATEDRKPLLAEAARRSQAEASWPTSRGWLASLLTERWQYIEQEQDEAELFDLSVDPEERVPVETHSGLASLMEEFDQEIEKEVPPGSLAPAPMPWEEWFTAGKPEAHGVLAGRNRPER